jgi:hypothetical protein
VNYSDVANVVAAIQVRYPDSRWAPDDEMVVKVWHMSIGDLPFAVVMRTLQSMFHDSRFAPDPSEIRARILEDSGLAPEPGDAWKLARAAISQYYPGFDNSGITMPEPVRQAVKAIGGLHALKMSEEPERDREAFLRVYGTYRKRAMSTVGLGLETGTAPVLEG